VKQTVLTVHTGARRGLFDITRECAEFVSGQGDGLLNVFVPHATAGVVIMELGAGSDDDLMDALDRVLPRDDRWRHAHGFALFPDGLKPGQKRLSTGLPHPAEMQLKFDPYDRLSMGPESGGASYTRRAVRQGVGAHARSAVVLSR
jgi:hypothetical protein